MGLTQRKVALSSYQPSSSRTSRSTQQPPRRGVDRHMKLEHPRRSSRLALAAVRELIRWAALMVRKKAPLMNRIALLVALLVAPSVLRASAVEPERAGQESSLIRAVFAEERLWVLSDAGQLFRITEGKDVPLEERLPEPALDLCLLGGRPAVVTCKRQGCVEWTLR